MVNLLPKVLINLFASLASVAGKMNEALMFVSICVYNNPSIMVRQKLSEEEILNNKGIEYVNRGNIIKAVKLLHASLSQNPNFAPAYFNLGNVYFMQAKLNRASVYYRKAIAKNYNFAKAYYNLAYVQQSLGFLPQAITYYKKYIEFDLHDARAYNNLAVALQDKGKIHEALYYFKKVLAIDSDNAVANNNLGAILCNNGEYEVSKKYFKKAIKYGSNFAEPFYNLGNVYHIEGRYKDAIFYYKQALEVKIDYHEALNSLGKAYEDLDMVTKARDYYLAALAIKSDFEPALAQLVHLERYICDWKEVTKHSKLLDKLTLKSLRDKRELGELPFMSITRSDNLSKHKRIAVARSRIIESRAKDMMTSTFDLRHSKNRRIIRLGYITNDFNDHPVAHLTKNMFSLHDRKKFEVYVYSYGFDLENKYIKKVIQGADKFTNLASCSFVEAAETINKDRIDILIDLKVHTKDERLIINALRPAPIQVTYLGFPGTLGADFIDYNIVDRVIVPKEKETYYTEKLVIMPDCYQINDHTQEISLTKTKKTDWGLPETAFVFCSFNKTLKIEPIMFTVWMRILKSVERSVLWLLRSSREAETNLKNEAEKRGVEPHRLIFADRIDLPQHLERLKLADLALDTRIYNGGATTSNALRVGVPVITLAGESYLSRMSDSLLTAVGLPDLICHSLKDYKDLATYYATHREELLKLHNKLTRYILTKPLYDSPRFVSKLETAYKIMWKTYLSGNLPRNIILHT